MRIGAVVVLIGCIGAGAAARAQEAGCEDAITQREMNDCAAQDFTAADQELNEAYGAARAALRLIDRSLLPDDRGAEAALRDAQRAWITFRDNACAAEGFRMRGGSAEALLVYSCMTRLTNQRIDDLWSLAEDEEN
jgi:uncharacterized protein YecT (DUF1311 family)